MGKDWIFKTDEYICDLWTVGVLVRDGDAFGGALHFLSGEIQKELPILNEGLLVIET